jgi:8-oxo-dGTP pyrophosphatase MutT (NUDIX family)
MTLNGFRRGLFWILSRTGLAVYSRLPIFGRLKASVAVIQNNETFLVIERSDDRGVSFPGGLALPWETAEQALARELKEETGLTLARSRLILRYDSSIEIPVNLTVFEVEASGELRDSWEGMPCWLPCSELQQRIIPSQRRVVEILQEQSAITDSVDRSQIFH